MPLYLMSRPLTVTARNGSGTFLLIALTQPVYHALKLGLIHKAGGGAGLFAGAFVMALFGIPASLLGLSLAALVLRDRRRRGELLRGLAERPGVVGVEVLSAGHMTFWGPFAHHRTSTALLLARTDGPEPAGGEFGEPIAVSDPARVRVRLRLKRKRTGGGEAVRPAPWDTNLAELLGRARMPEGVAATWRAALAADAVFDGRWARARRVLAPGPLSLLQRAARVLDVDYDRALRVGMIIDGVSGDGRRSLGSVAVGAAVRDLAGAGLLGRLRRLLGLPSAGVLPLDGYDVSRGAGGVRLSRRA